MVSYLGSFTDDNLQKYAPRELESIANAGAKFIARGMPVATFENGIMQRTVIAEFETTEAAKGAFTSDA